MTIGDRIRTRREELGLTQKELAERLGYKTKSSITKIEAGDNNLPITKVAKIAKALEAKGITNYTLNIGGNIRTIGPKADGSPWLATITKSEIAFGGEKTLKVKLEGQSFVTSGTYQRYYTVDGVDYHHIIDPDTLMPRFDFISISVCCNDSGLADVIYEYILQ